MSQRMKEYNESDIKTFLKWYYKPGNFWAKQHTLGNTVALIFDIPNKNYEISKRHAVEDLKRITSTYRHSAKLIQAMKQIDAGIKRANRGTRGSTLKPQSGAPSPKVKRMLDHIYTWVSSNAGDIVIAEHSLKRWVHGITGKNVNVSTPKRVLKISEIYALYPTLNEGDIRKLYDWVNSPHAKKVAEYMLREEYMMARHEAEGKPGRYKPKPFKGTLTGKQKATEFGQMISGTKFRKMVTDHTRGWSPNQIANLLMAAGLKHDSQRGDHNIESLSGPEIHRIAMHLLGGKNKGLLRTRHNVGRERSDDNGPAQDYASNVTTKDGMATTGTDGAFNAVYGKRRYRKKTEKPDPRFNSKPGDPDYHDEIDNIDNPNHRFHRYSRKKGNFDEREMMEVHIMQYLIKTGQLSEHDAKHAVQSMPEGQLRRVYRDFMMSSAKSKSTDPTGKYVDKWSISGIKSVSGVGGMCANCRCIIKSEEERCPECNAAVGNVYKSPEEIDLDHIALRANELDKVIVQGVTKSDVRIGSPHDTSDAKSSQVWAFMSKDQRAKLLSGFRASEEGDTPDTPYEKLSYKARRAIGRKTQSLRNKYEHPDDHYAGAWESMDPEERVKYIPRQFRVDARVESWVDVPFRSRGEFMIEIEDELDRKFPHKMSRHKSMRNKRSSLGSNFGYVSPVGKYWNSLDPEDRRYYAKRAKIHGVDYHSKLSWDEIGVAGQLKLAPVLRGDSQLDSYEFQHSRRNKDEKSDRIDLNNMREDLLVIVAMDNHPSSPEFQKYLNMDAAQVKREHAYFMQHRKLIKSKKKNFNNQAS